VVVVAALMAGAGCTAGQDDGGRATTSAASDGASAQLPAPVMVAADQARAQARIGETIVFQQPDPADTRITTDRPDLLELIQGSDDGSAQFNPVAIPRATGVAVVTIEAVDGSTSTVTVTVLP
jgi:hypothetical protein